MSVIIDNRERELIPLWNGWKVKVLPVGDIWIGCSGEEIQAGSLVLERKRAADLESSILDGRYREQRTRLQAFCAERGAHVGYIIEGDLDRLGARLDQKVLWKFLCRLMFVHKIPIFQTSSIQETADFCRVLAEKWGEDQKDFREGKVTTYTSTIKHHTKGEQRDDPFIFAVSVLTCCKGISTTTAEALLKGFGGHLAGVWAATEEQLAQQKISEKQKLGPAKAKKLYGLLHSGQS